MKVASPLVLVSALLLVAATPAEAQATSGDAYQSTLTPNCPRPGAPADTPCPITIIVPSNCGSGIHVAPDPIVVRGNTRVTIRWNITGEWEFAASNGIFVHQAPEKAFTSPNRTADGKTFTVVFQGQRPGTYKYDINLKRGSQVCRIDPVIVNW